MGNFGGFIVFCVSNFSVLYLKKKIFIIYKMVVDNYFSVNMVFFVFVCCEVFIFMYMK